MGRVIKVKVDYSRREQALIAQRKQRAMFSRIVCAVCVVTVIVVAVAFGPVWLVADATRMSQASAILKTQVSDALVINQKLVIDEAVMKSNDHLAVIAKDELGMVEPSGTITRIALRETPPETTQRPQTQSDSLWRRVAQLTMGETSALLIGDVGISALR